MTPQEKKQIFNTVAYIVISIILILVAISVFNAGSPWIALGIVIVPLTILFYKHFG